MEKKGDLAAPTRGAGKGNFFAVDRRRFYEVCKEGSADLAAAYLVLAAGTGADNRTSTWSAEAIKNYSSQTWRKAKSFIERLVEKGHVCVVKAGARPRYDLPPLDNRRMLNATESRILKRITNGGGKLSKAHHPVADQLVALGYAKKTSDKYTPVSRARRDLVWLPNSLVTGLEGERPPVERLRTSRSVMAFRLLIDLYALQDLAEHQGIDRNALWIRFQRSILFSYAPYLVWRFEKDVAFVDWREELLPYRDQLSAEQQRANASPAKTFFETLQTLENAGAIEWVTWLCEGSDQDRDACLLHPVDLVQSGSRNETCTEAMIGRYARKAALALAYASGMDDNVLREIDGYSDQYCIPVERIVQNASLIGVPRLRHRARNSNTARWRSDLVDLAAEKIAGFRAIISRHAVDILVTEEDWGIADFKETSTDNSTVVQRWIKSRSTETLSRVAREENVGPRDVDGQEGFVPAE